MSDRTFHFNEGCHVTFNDIHDNTNCTIYTSRQPHGDAVSLPHEKDYKAVIEWLQSEKEAGRDWYAMNNNNRSAMCRHISTVLGWLVDANSLGRAINRK
ncbi:MAG: hypothetical protein MJZ75_04185 [Paludibacteraceae bacterium]|nr:hypothetical protein [Paludibacteraceae bacterium]